MTNSTRGIIERINTDKYTTAPEKPQHCRSCSSGDFIENWTDVPGEDFELFLYHYCPNCKTLHNDRREQLPNSIVQKSPGWEEIFGHPSPYPHQEDAIAEAIKVGKDEGYTVIEGGCGTGKTMIALTAGVKLIRDENTDYEQMLILTSVKQQLQQFEEDLRIINKNLPIGYEPVAALTLVGKEDVCPYACSNAPSFEDKDTNRHCQNLRSNTTNLIENEGYTGSQLATYIEKNTTTDWTLHGENSPYPRTVPIGEEEKYCPFYARYQSTDADEFLVEASNSILNPQEAVRLGMKHGLCPHSAIASLSGQAEVVIANYMHAYDFDTLRITNDLIDESTFLVCDEAHMHVPRVRNILSDSASAGAIWKSIQEAKRVLAGVDSQPISPDSLRKPVLDSGYTHAILQENKCSATQVKDWYEVLKSIVNVTDSIVSNHLDTEYPQWDTTPEQLPERIEIPLRDPSTSEDDLLTKWINNNQIPETVWTSAEAVADGIIEVLDTVDQSYNSRASEDVAWFFKQWATLGNDENFREIVLYRKNTPEEPDSWRDIFASYYEIHNCMPRGMIISRLDSFGGGIFMSATLEPLEVFQDVTGLEYQAEMKERTITEQRYHSPFPPENNLSVAVNLDKFTWENRGDVDEETPTRREYLQAIKMTVRGTDGNVLVCMPSYPEAEWAATELSKSPEISKPVITDESSTDEETNQLKEEFFRGQSKCLVTSLRGTLTEGVDYSGEKLSGCVVCGVPIANIQSAQTRAIINAYRERYGYKKGFEYSMTVPAVRKARQALGRVIRGKDEVGIRVLLDERYCKSGDEGVRQYLSEVEQEQYEIVNDVDELEQRIGNFSWSRE